MDTDKESVFNTEFYSLEISKNAGMLTPVDIGTVKSRCAATIYS